MDEDRNYGRDNNWDNLGYRGTGSRYDNDRDTRARRDPESDYRSRSRDSDRDDNRREYGGTGSFYGSNRDDYGSRGGSYESSSGYGAGQSGGGYDEWSRRDNRTVADRYSTGGAYGGSFASSRPGPNDDWRREDRGSWDRSRDAGYGSQFGSNLSASGQSYGGGERGASQGGRGLWDKASDEVSSWFGDRDAERRRDQDQHRGRGPKNYSRSDDRIRDDVNDRLTDDGWLDASNIEVSVKDREVTLSGSVGDRNAKRRAEDVAEGVSGVSHVQNNLRIKSNEATGTDVDVDRTGAAGMVAKSAAGGQR